MKPSPERTQAILLGILSVLCADFAMDNERLPLFFLAGGIAAMIAFIMACMSWR